MQYAEDLNFWQTSQTSSDTWVERAKKQIETLGGKIEGEGFGMDGKGKSGFMLAFSIGGDVFKIIWPVMESWKKNTKAARIQSATMLYHYVKGVCLRAAVSGVRNAFAGDLLLPDGRTVSQTVDEDANVLVGLFPQKILIEHKEGPK